MGNEDEISMREKYWNGVVTFSTLRVMLPVCLVKSGDLFDLVSLCKEFRRTYLDVLTKLADRLVTTGHIF